MQCKIIGMILSLTTFLIPSVLTAPHPINTIPSLRYIPGSFVTVLKSMTRDPHGFLQLGPDGVLRSFTANGTTVLDYRQLDAAQTARFAPDGRAMLAEDALLHPRAAPSYAGPAVPRGTGPAFVLPPEIVGGGCSPPLACRNSTTCGGGCVSCTYLGFFPYGLCLSG
ncbi:Fc.00g005380.m01.CDS01 [Cosmosporella sp. VM-42]